MSFYKVNDYVLFRDYRLKEEDDVNANIPFFGRVLKIREMKNRANIEDSYLYFVDGYGWVEGWNISSKIISAKDV
jgi:hypothetical protein